VLYVGGLAQLVIITGSLATATLIGVLPFAAADLVKALVAGALSGPRRDVRS
jgi:biotin transporter BioY